MPPLKKKRTKLKARRSTSSYSKGKSSVDVEQVLTGLQPSLQEHIKRAEANQEKVVSLLGKMEESNNNISVSMSRIADALSALAKGGKQ